MQRKQKRRTRAHLLRLTKQVLKSEPIVQYRHGLVDRMIAGIRDGNQGNESADVRGAALRETREIQGAV